MDESIPVDEANPMDNVKSMDKDKPLEMLTLFEVDYNKIDFYKDSNFLEVIQKYPHFHFESYYCYYLRTRKFTTDYAVRLDATLPILANLLLSHTDHLGIKGNSQFSSLALMTMLQKEGFWSAVVDGAIHFEFDGKSNYDDIIYRFKKENLIDVSAGQPYAWLFCPPFECVDISLKYQRIPDGLGNDIEYVILETLPDYKGKIPNRSDYADLKLMFVNTNNSFEEERELFDGKFNFAEFNSFMPPFLSYYDNFDIRYIPCGNTYMTAQSTGEFSKIEPEVMSIYETKIKPELHKELEKLTYLKGYQD